MLQFTKPAVVNGTHNVVYGGFKAVASGGVQPYTYSVQNLPTGLSIGSANGYVYGTPTVASTYSNVILKVVDNVHANVTLSALTIKIA